MTKNYKSIWICKRGNLILFCVLINVAHSSSFSPMGSMKDIQSFCERESPRDIALCRGVQFTRLSDPTGVVGVRVTCFRIGSVNAGRVRLLMLSVISPFIRLGYCPVMRSVSRLPRRRSTSTISALIWWAALSTVFPDERNSTTLWDRKSVV